MAQHLDVGTTEIIARKSGRIGWIVYNNPDRRNAMTRAMIAAVPRALDDFAADPDIRVVVLRGAGNIAFVSGADISELGERAGNPADAVMAGSGIGSLIEFDKPIIAMVNGFCIGGGLLVALCADIRIAANHAQFAAPPAKLGVAYPFEAVALLVDLVGPGTANEMLMSGSRMSAANALRVGLVNRVVAADSLEAEVIELAGALAANAPLSMRAGKFAVRALGSGAGADARAGAVDAIRAAWDSDDARRGPEAFLAGRSPEFTGD